MTGYSHIAIIYNPNSTGDAPSNAHGLATELRKLYRQSTVDLLETKRAGHAEELACDYAKKYHDPLVISASGDGGYHEVINGALRAQEAGAAPICAVLASGNANDHARTVQSRPLLELIRDQSEAQLDVLQVSLQSGKKTIQRYAHAYVGIGLTPTVAVELNKHTLNSLREAWIVTRTFWNFRPVTIERSGKLSKLDSLVCSTIPGMAKVLTFKDTSQPDDGMFEITAFPHHRKITLLLRLVKGVFRHMDAKTRSATYDFKLITPAPMQIDGEVIDVQAGTAVTISLAAGLLKTLA